MDLVKRGAAALCLLAVLGACAGVVAPHDSIPLEHSHRQGKSFGLKSLFGFGGHSAPATTTVRPAPKQIWKIHKYHGIELRPVLNPPVPAKVYGPPAETYGPPVETYGPPIETYGPPAAVYGPPAETYEPIVVEQEQEQSHKFKFPFKFGKFLKQKVPITREEVYPPEPLPYSAPVEIYQPPSTSYGTPVTSYGTPVASYATPVTSYGTPAEPYDTPVEAFSPPAHAFNKLPETRAPVEAYVLPHPVYGPPPPTYVYKQKTQTIRFPFKKIPKIMTVTEDPAPLEVYSPDGVAAPSATDGLDDLDNLAIIATHLPEGAESSSALDKILEVVDLDTIASVLEFLNSKNRGPHPIDLSALIELTEFFPHIDITRGHFDIGALIHSIPDLTKGHTGKLPAFFKKSHPKLLTLLTVLKGLKAIEITKLGHILGIGKKHHGPKVGILGKVGKAAAVVGVGKVAKLGVIGASVGAFKKPFKHIGDGLSSIGGKFKKIPEYLTKIVTPSGSHSASIVPDLPGLPNLGLKFPTFPKISISGGYKLQRNTGAPYIRISYPQRSTETKSASYPDASMDDSLLGESDLVAPAGGSSTFDSSLVPVTTSEEVSAPVIPTTLTVPSTDASATLQLPEPRLPSTSSSSSLTGHYASATLQLPEPRLPSTSSSSSLTGHYAPEQVVEVVAELPQTYAPAQETYSPPQAAVPVYHVPKTSYPPQTPQYIRHVIKLPLGKYRAPEPTYQAPQPVYSAPVAPETEYVVPEAPEQIYSVPNPAYNVPQTAQQIRHTVKLPQYQVYEQINEAPQQTYQPRESYQVPQQSYRLPLASEPIAQASRHFPRTVYQSRSSYEDYEEDEDEHFGFESPEYNPEETKSVDIVVPTEEVESDDASQVREKDVHSSKQFYAGQHISSAKAKPQTVQSTNIEELKELSSEVEEIVDDDTYASASELDESVVAAPDDVENDESVSDKSVGNVSGSSKQVFKSGTSRSSSAFTEPSSISGFEPSSASAMTGSGYSRVVFQRSATPAKAPNVEKASPTVGNDDVVNMSKRTSALPITAAKKLASKSGPRSMEQTISVQ